MKTLVIGRSPFADIVIADGTVAPHHAELIVTDDGRLYLVNCDSPGGTWRLDPSEGHGAPDDRRGFAGGETWRQIRQGFVRRDEPLRLGDFHCTGESLLRAARDAAPAHPGAAAGASAGAAPGDGGRQPLRGRVERDATTGEIVRRRP